MKQFDVTVIGAGPGGYVAAIRAAQRGAKVALVEKEYLGGTCLNWGCIPTKALIASGDVLATVREAGHFGIDLDGVADPNWPAMIKRKNGIVQNLRQGIGSLMKSNDIEVLQGTASFTGRKRLMVALADGGKEEIESNAVIVATGGAPIRPAFIPASPLIYDSRAILDLEKLPKSILILGGGVIGCEFACLLAQLDVEVTLVELLPSILPGLDSDVVRAVLQEMKNLGINVMTGTRMTAVSATTKAVKADTEMGAITAEAMLVCIGRKACTDGLNLKAAGLSTDEKGCLPVNDKCRTKAAGIYAIGDVTGGIQLAHRASAMALCAADNATGHEDRYTDNLVPSCIFTRPEIGAVGVTETEAKAKGLQVKVGKFPFMALGKAMVMNETRGFCKIIADAASDQVLGVHIVGAHAADLISESVAAMRLEVTAEELGRAIHPHPTLSEATMEAAHAVHDACIHLPRSRRRH